MGLNDRSADIQAHAHAVGFGGVKRVKKSVPNPLRDTVTPVYYGEHHGLIATADNDL